MKTDLQLFDHTEFGRIRVIQKKGKEWLEAIRVAKILGYENPRKAVIDHCKEKGIVTHEVLTAGGKQEMKFIDEGNLYRLIIRSKLPAAEQFESWVFDDVLPSIRRSGRYALPSAEEIAVLHPSRLLLNGPTWGEKYSEEKIFQETGQLFISLEEVARRCGIYTAQKYVAKPHGKFIQHLIMVQLIEIEEDEIMLSPLHLRESVVPKVAEWMRDRDYPTKITFGKMTHKLQVFRPQTSRGYYVAGEYDPHI